MIEQLFSKAKAKLLVENPAFGHIISKMKFSQNDNIQNIISDGKRFEYNDEFIQTLSQEELIFAFSHASMHKILNHTSRKQKRFSYLWQLASDYAISSLLLKSGFELPSFARYQKRFDGMYAEEIYAILQDEIKNEEFSDDEELETGFNEENKQQQKRSDQTQKDPTKQNENFQLESELEERLEQKFIEDLLNKYYEEFPEPIKRYINLPSKPTINWKQLLRNAINTYAKHDYVIYPASKKLLYQGVYLPSLKSETLEITIVIDSSGSIDQQLLEEFLSEVASILLIIPSYTVDFFIIDDAIRSHQTLQKGDPFPPKYVLGGCGTDFRVIFSYLQEKHLYPNLLLYFTDLEGFFPEKKPSFDVIWVTKSKKEVNFGKKIYLPEGR
ncbi:MAG: hypothetical protein GXO11_07610 [Epsilonproteobacteria bacterium]|nr:hypothetical protein [Campylobacterota bacterium]